MRILPRSNDDVNQQWISDKTRFSYDGLKCQRLHYPLMLQEEAASHIVVSWERALTRIKEKILELGAPFGLDRAEAVIGPFVDQESVSMLKRFMSRLGASGTRLG